MQNIMQVARYMYKLTYIVMIKFKLLKAEKMFNISKIACYQVIHSKNMITFFNKAIAKM